jgi:hypothetical protein
MVRAVLSLVLMPMLALPHGVCFCQFVEAGPTRSEPVRCECETPDAPPENPDDDDGDCSCKLREVAVRSTAPFEHINGDDLALYAVDGLISVQSTDISGADHIPPFRACPESLPLILCALRI